MPKKKEEFLDLLFNELTKIVEKTLETLKPLEWKIKGKEQKENKVQWLVKVPNQLLPGYSFLLDLFAGAYHKLLVIEVYDNKILAECKEEMSGYVIDWQGEKKQILDEFFLHLNSMLKSGTLYKGKVPKRYDLSTKLAIVFLIIFVIIGILILVFFR